MEAKATGVEAGVVIFEAKGGRVVKVPLDKLADADRQVLEEHFKVDASGNAAPDFGHPLGEVSGPVDAGGSKYFVYLPKNLKNGVKVPLVFYTAAEGGSADTLKSLTEGADICNWIVACSVESKGVDDANQDHTKKCLDHLWKNLPVDEKRVYFAGSGDGARTAYANAAKFKGIGVLAQMAGAQTGELKKENSYFFISGASDYERYAISSSYTEVARTSALRFHPGGHVNAPDWLVTEGLVWLEGRWLRAVKEDSPERSEYELSVLRWINNLKGEEEYRAAWWAGFLRESGVMEDNKAALDTLADLTAEPANAAYADGIAKLEEFAALLLSTGPLKAPESYDDTSEEIQAALAKLLETHATTPWVKDVLEALKKKTEKGQ